VTAVPATTPTTHLPDHNRTVFESTDTERTEAFLTTAFGTSMTISGDRRDYRFRLARLGSGPLQITTVEHTPTTDTCAEPMPDHLVVVRMHHGVRTNVDLDDHLGPGDLGLHAQPGQPIRIRMESGRYTAVFIPKQAAADAARIRPDDELGPLHFDSLRPTGQAAKRRWLKAIEYVADNLQADPEAMVQPLLTGAAARLLAATLLSAFPNTWTREPRHLDRTDGTPTTLSRAIAFIETSSDIDITVVDIARAARVTVRAVQLAFRRHLDTTPMAYVRRVRLQRVHEQLHAATPGDGATVTTIAARWGFADLSRFASLYRRTYGQPPSNTLRV
jgi:AraC-like DNA-binding protein